MEMMTYFSKFKVEEKIFQIHSFEMLSYKNPALQSTCTDRLIN